MIKINFQSIIQKNLPKGIKQPHRSQIYVGFQCHQQCGFCYYKDHYHEQMFSKEYVLKQIDIELAYGITDFEITGGEPSECKDLTYYCQYIKSRLPTAKIAIITNGGLWKNIDVWKYIDEVLVSYHLSRNDNSFDKSMFPLGDTYDKASKTIAIAKKLNKIVRTNTVIGTFNIDSINLIVDDLMSFKPNIINFLPVNMFDDAKNMDRYIDYKKLRPIIKNVIDHIKLSSPNTLVFIRYMPFCDMEGYEQHILGTLQHIYDWFDWNSELCGDNILRYIEKFESIHDVLVYLGKYGKRSLEKACDCIDIHYEKNEKCLKCKYYVICDGVEKTENHALLDQIAPTNGQFIKNPMEFIGDSIYDLYNKLYNN